MFAVVSVSVFSLQMVPVTANLAPPPAPPGTDVILCVRCAGLMAIRVDVTLNA